MKFYIASALANARNVKIAADQLKAMGHKQTYDWTVHGDVRNQGAQKMAQVAQSEANAVINAELVIVLLPGKWGTHIEIGMAIASAQSQDALKQIWLWSETGEHFAYDERTCAFYFHPNIRRLTGSFDQVLNALREEYAPAE